MDPDVKFGWLFLLVFFILLAVAGGVDQGGAL